MRCPDINFNKTIVSQNKLINDSQQENEIMINTTEKKKNDTFKSCIII